MLRRALRDLPMAGAAERARLARLVGIAPERLGGDTARVPALIESHAGDGLDDICDTPVDLAIAQLTRMVDAEDGERRAA